MTEAEMRRFLQAQPARTGKLATVRADGRPHVAPIWFVLKDNELIFTTWHETVKAANLRHNHHVAVCVDDQQPPFAFVIVEGLALVDEDAADLKQWTTRLAARYMGEEQAEAFGRRNAVPGEWLVRVAIGKMFGEKNIAGW
jgi:PPOX class probable F420-dependent enzyme